MALDIKMPALSPTMEEGTLAKWLVKVGDTVSSGDPLLDQAARAVLRLDDLQRLDAAVRGLTQEQRRIVEQSLRRD